MSTKRSLKICENKHTQIYLRGKKFEHFAQGIMKYMKMANHLKEWDAKQGA